MNYRARLACVAIVVGTCASTQAADFSTNRALSETRLDDIRGGFDMGGNMVASFALQRTVLINGVTALSTVVSVPDIANITRDQATALQNALQTTVISNGPGGVGSSTVTPLARGADGLSSMAPNLGGPGLVIQNSLDNQSIMANTTVDASVNSARMLENMRVAEAIQDSTIQFRRN